MTLLMLRTAPLNDGLPVSTTKLISRTLRKLVAQLETTEVESSPKRYDSKSICTGKVPKPLRESESDICISDTLKNNWMKKATVLGQDQLPRSYTVKTEDGNHLASM